MDGQKGDQELQDFIAMESTRAQFQQHIHKLTNSCWDKCMDKPRDSLDSKQEGCFTNCVERFIDTSFIISKRFQALLQKQLQG